MPSNEIVCSFITIDLILLVRNPVLQFIIIAIKPFVYFQFTYLTLARNKTIFKKTCGINWCEGEPINKVNLSTASTQLL
jgi:hypothetical protein